jgi:hypothetical protein
MTISTPHLHYFRYPVAMSTKVFPYSSFLRGPGDRTAGVGSDQLVANYPDAADRAWVARTSNPRRTDERHHQLKGRLAQTTFGGQLLDHRQIEATAGSYNQNLWMHQRLGGATYLPH